MSAAAATRAVPSSLAVLMTLVRVTWRRLFRGRAVWVSVLIAALPVAFAAALQGTNDQEALEAVQFLVTALLPPMFVASSLGEEIEERTTTYLWSRPLARWTVVIGKLFALAPIAMALVVGSWFAGVSVMTGQPPPADSLIAFGAGSIAISAMSAGIATIVPRHGMALSIVYLVIFDLALGAIPASIQNIAITHHVREMITLGADKLQPAIAMAAIAAVWIAIALWRVRRLES